MGPVAWTDDEIRRIGYLVVDVIADHLRDLPSEPVFRPVPPDRIQEFLTEPLPEEGCAPVESPARVRRAHRALSVRQRPPAVLGVGQFSARRHGHLRRRAGGGDESELRRRQSRRDLRRTAGDRLAARDARVPARCHGPAHERRIDGLADGARRRAAHAVRRRRPGARAAGRPRTVRPLPLVAGPQLHQEGHRAARVRQRFDPDDRRGRRLPDRRWRAGSRGCG